MKLPEDLLQEFTNKLSLLPKGPGEDIKKNMQSVLQGLFSKLDLVTRDEFEAQQAVLLKTRSKIDALEKTVAALEATLQPSAPSKES